MDDYIDKVAVPQVQEILDELRRVPRPLVGHAGSDMNADRAASRCLPVARSSSRTSSPTTASAAVIKGDTETPEQNIPATGIQAAIGKPA